MQEGGEERDYLSANLSIHLVSLSRANGRDGQTHLFAICSFCACKAATLSSFDALCAMCAWLKGFCGDCTTTTVSVSEREKENGVMEGTSLLEGFEELVIC